MSDWYHHAFEPDAENPTVLGARLIKNSVDRFALPFFSSGAIQIEGRSTDGWVGRAWRDGGLSAMSTAPQSSPQAAADELSRMIVAGWVFIGWKAGT